MKKRYLVTPGPSPVPQEVRLALAEEIIHHRTSEFQNYLKTGGGEPQEDIQDAGTTPSSSRRRARARWKRRSPTWSAPAKRPSPSRAASSASAGRSSSRPTAARRSSTRSSGAPAQAARTSRSSSRTTPTSRRSTRRFCETSTATRQDVEALGKVVAPHQGPLRRRRHIGRRRDGVRTDDWNIDMLVSARRRPSCSRRDLRSSP